MKGSNGKGQGYTALYMRLSKEDGERGESESIRNQRSLLLHFVKKHEIANVKEYIDDGYSGTQFVEVR